MWEDINKRNLIKFLIDITCLELGVITAMILKYENSWAKYFLIKGILVYMISFAGTYLAMKAKSKSWRYSSVEDIKQTIELNIISGLIYGIIRNLFIAKTDITLIIMAIIFITGFQLLARYAFRYRRHYKVRKNIETGKIKKIKAVIYGAGEAGISIMVENKRNPEFPYDITAIIDDDPDKKGTIIHGVKVIGDFTKLKSVLSMIQAEALIIAMPSAEKEKVNNIIHEVEGLDIQIKILPRIDEILTGESLTSQIRNVNISDLLGRSEVEVNGEEIKKLIENKTILITGGAGSIGSELARQIAKHNPKSLVTVDVNENAIYFLELELKRQYPNLKLTSEICNIREKDKLELLFQRYRPEIVFHAAAHKHVPLMEHNPEEAIKNNIFGTRNTAECADKYGTERFVLISTDKAVNPTNIMGATKRACELVVEEINKSSATKFMAVRFGNVLGSNGSVIPIFKSLIEEGKNLTITHENITRYFMTIPEAAQLVIEAGSLGTGGEVFILDMGEPVKIMDLAKKMIKLSKAKVGIDVVGLRPGEKLYEELLYDVNAAIKTENKKIFITRLAEECTDVTGHLEKLTEAVKKPKTEELKELMKRFITSYEEPEHHKKQPKMAV